MHAGSLFRQSIALWRWEMDELSLRFGTLVRRNHYLQQLFVPWQAAVSSYDSCMMSSSTSESDL